MPRAWFDRETPEWVRAVVPSYGDFVLYDQRAWPDARVRWGRNQYLGFLVRVTGTGEWVRCGHPFSLALGEAVRARFSQPGL